MSPGVILPKNVPQAGSWNRKFGVIKPGHAENPPLHLPIGTDSINSYKTSAEKLAQDVSAWMDDSFGTDYLLK